jgi:3-hydroxyisobutyrate dehydrogenase
MARIGFMGLGRMGFPMAGHLALAGHEMQVFNRTSDKIERWLRLYPGKQATTPRHAAEGADILITCIGDEPALCSVLSGEDGAVQTLMPGALVIDHSTISATLAYEMANIVQESGGTFLDAPVSGGEAGAVNGTLSIMCGGEETAYRRAQTVFDAYAKIHRHIGPSGSGQRAKMVNQIAIAGLLQGLSEALHFCEKAGLDGEKVLEVIREGAAASWQMHHRSDTMLARRFDFGFSMKNLKKSVPPFL